MGLGQLLVEVSGQTVVHPVLEEFARKLRDTAEELCQDLLGVSEFSRGCRLCGFPVLFFKRETIETNTEFKNSTRK